MCFKECSCLCFWKPKVFLFSSLLPSLNLFPILEIQLFTQGISLNFTFHFCTLNLSLVFMVSFITSMYMRGYIIQELKSWPLDLNRIRSESKFHHLFALLLWETTQFMHLKMGLPCLPQRVGRTKWDKVYKMLGHWHSQLFVLMNQRHIS